MGVKLKLYPTDDESTVLTLLERVEEAGRIAARQVCLVIIIITVCLFVLVCLFVHFSNGLIHIQVREAADSRKKKKNAPKGPVEAREGTRKRKR